MINKKDFRTYHRRPVTRRSGYKASGEKTGGECIIYNADAYISKNQVEEFIFYRKLVNLEELFENNIGILAFGGYIYTEYQIEINFVLNYKIGNMKFEFKKSFSKPINTNDWNPIGFHKEFSLDLGNVLNDVYLKMYITTPKNNILQFICFDLDAITYDYYKSIDSMKLFRQKTSMHIPHIYYLNTLLPITKYLIDNKKEFLTGNEVVLKSCNRCTRYLPINIDHEVNTLGFSLHCKKKAPCSHSLFRSYKIDNIEDLDEKNLTKDYISANKVISYYGHQLECKACKKFYVNAPLNPKRNSQQFREDSLRRRALEVLVNTLLDNELVHHEFRKKNNREFSEYIWNKFNGRCFKCRKKLSLDEMHLDHTMPLAYLYPLDETATCLCSEHNSKKRDHFPIDFYTEEELLELEKITGLSYDILHSKKPNYKVINLLINNVTWFFDVFLADNEYQKTRDGKLTADKIYASIVRILNDSIDLLEEYYKINKKYPTTITLKDKK